MFKLNKSLTNMKTFIVNNAKERGKNSYQIKFTRHLGEGVE